VEETFWRLRAGTVAFLEEGGEEGLDRPTTYQPPGWGGFETVGSAITIIAYHACGHFGGAHVVRRASGKQLMSVQNKELRAFSRIVIRSSVDREKAGAAIGRAG
jgi:hypothetical protein